MTQQMARVAVLAGAALGGWGCRPEPPPRVPVPPPHAPQARRELEPAKPLPDQDANLARLAPGYDDPPLLVQRVPEQRAFVDAYRRVGSPRIAVFVNRTLEGELVPVNRREPVAGYEYQQRSTTGVTVESQRWREDSAGGALRRDRYREDRTNFRSDGPGEYHESLDVYLKRGEYDDAQARALDYAAMETILSDWLAAEGQVALMSPTMVRQRLTDEQVRELQSGRPQVLRELAQQLDADVLIQAQAHPTKQTPQGLWVRVVAEAFNTRDGLSIGRAVVDVPPPLDKPQLNTYTRYLARKLMDDMTWAWMAPPPDTGGPTTQP